MNLQNEMLRIRREARISFCFFILMGFVLLSTPISFCFGLALAFRVFHFHRMMNLQNEMPESERLGVISFCFFDIWACLSK